jgi:hypothetical protein
MILLSQERQCFSRANKRSTTPTACIRFAVLSRIEMLHILLEHSYDSQRNENAGSARRLHRRRPVVEKPGSAQPAPTVPAAARHLGYGFVPVPRVDLATITAAAGHREEARPDPSQRGVQPIRRQQPTKIALYVHVGVTSSISVDASVSCLRESWRGDSTSIGGLTSLRSAWSRCPYWLTVTLRSAACCLASSSARSVVRQLITPPSQISHTPSRRGEHRTDAQKRPRLCSGS